MVVDFVVEHAGCPSCAERVRAALTSLGDVREIEIDEAEDVARVRTEVPASTSRDVIEQTVVAAPAGSGHEYRVRPGSWQTMG
jgi:copper chaperone CopZ